MGLRVLDDLGNHRPLVDNSGISFGLVDIFVEVFAKGPQFHVKDGGLHFIIMLLGDNRLFGGIHATNRRTPGIGVMRVTRTDALHPGQPLGMAAVRGPAHDSAAGTGGRKQPLELERSNHVLQLAVAKFPAYFRLIGLQTGSEDDRADFNIELFVAVVKVDGLGITDLFTFPANLFGEIQTVRRINCPGIGNGLRKQGVDGLSLIQSLVKEIRDLGWTFRFTGAASRTSFRIDIAGLLLQGGGEIPFNPRNFQDPGHGMHFYIGVTTGFDHARGNHTHGAIAGGKRLIQPGHRTAD
ncbi:MAG: hypothetical protein ACD_75C01194G0001 [uncultured bacterium]|nr:MAG: hypothetical protein ACD_75C01194G0001 [uncultured bacterium]